MKIFTFIFMALTVLAGVTDAANATYYNATFDCGGGQTVWIANPVVGHGEEQKRIVIFEIRITNFDFTKGPIRSPVVQWDNHNDEVTLDGRSCRQMTEEEVNKTETTEGEK